MLNPADFKKAIDQCRAILSGKRVSISPSLSIVDPGHYCLGQRSNDTPKSVTFDLIHNGKSCKILQIFRTSKRLRILTMPKLQAYKSAEFHFN